MSHISTIKVLIKGDADGLAALDEACRALGVTLMRDQKTFKNYNGRKNKCDMAIVDQEHSEAYQIGLVMTADGTGYQIQMDNYQGGKGMNDKVGYSAGKLLQRYGLNAATAQARKQGMRVIGETVEANGSIKLVLEPKPAYATAGAGKSAFGAY